jgi:hypothetical protein
VAFIAGMVSFLSPCVLPVVPSYVGFVSGMTLEELKASGRAEARRRAAVHSALFVLGFSLVFIALGASSTALGGAMRRSLPLLQELGGAVIVLFGLHLLGVLRTPALMRDRRVQLASKPAGNLGSVVVGVAFGAGWTQRFTSRLKSSPTAQPSPSCRVRLFPTGASECPTRRSAASSTKWRSGRRCSSTEGWPRALAFPRGEGSGG